MNTYWTQIRPNGQPVEPGTVCYVQDPEDGTNPIFTYGANQQEVLDKVARNNLNAQRTLSERRRQPAQPGSPSPGPVAVPKPMTSDEVAQATADLGNPAKAGSAIARLAGDALGLDLNQVALDNFKRLAEEWEQETPEFYPHPGNRTLVGDLAGRKVGRKVGLITKELLTECFHEMQDRGMLFAAPAQPITPQPEPSTVSGREPGAARVERPRGEVFSTGASSRRFRAPQTPQTRTLKYTEEQIRTMPMAKSQQLIEDNDPDYAAACDYYYREASA
jgi:hypothetical protein